MEALAPHAEPAQTPSVALEPSEPSVRTIRMDVDRLDGLVDLVGELVLARNHLLRIAHESPGHEGRVAGLRIDRVTNRLQDAVMHLRMQRCAVLFDPLAEVVRGTAESRGLVAHLRLEGHDTELDRTLVEALGPSVSDLVRAVIVGHVTGTERTAELHLHLRAFQQGGDVHLELLVPGAVVGPDALPQGLESTLHRLGGRLHLDRDPQGRMRIGLVVPLTIAILSALTVVDDGQCYAIPRVGVEEIVRPGDTPLADRLEHVGDHLVHRLRGRLLHVLHLGERLRGAAPGPDVKDSQRLLVLRTPNGHFGLVVDALLDSEEIVVRPLGRRLQGLPNYTGAAVRGDGRVALVLDVNALGAGVAHEPEARVASLAPSHGTSLRRMMLVRLRPGRRALVPVEQVRHIARFPSRSIEHRVDRLLARDEQGSLPVRTLAGATAQEDWDPLTTERDCPTLIVHHARGRVGFLVDAVEDIVRVPAEPNESGALVGDDVVEIVDLLTLIPANPQEAA